MPGPEGPDRALRAFIYGRFRDDGTAPSILECAAAMGTTAQEVTASLERLADNRTLVLQPNTGEVWMAHPFSGVPTDFEVTVGGRSWFANCGWDAFAIISLFGDGWFETQDPNSGDRLRWDVRDGVIEPDGVVHFAVPARDFWQDIGFT